MPINLPSKVRWPEVLADLERAGVSNAELARRVGMTRSAMTRLKDCSQPHFHNGMAILRVWADAVAEAA